jgi:hypothetical protein
MRAVLVVIANIVEEKSPQKDFVHRNNLIQQLSSTAFDPALRHPVLPWTLERGLHRLNPERSHGGGNLHPGRVCLAKTSYICKMSGLAQN